MELPLKVIDGQFRNHPPPMIRAGGREPRHLRAHVQIPGVNGRERGGEAAQEGAVVRRGEPLPAQVLHRHPRGRGAVQIGRKGRRHALALPGQPRHRAVLLPLRALQDQGHPRAVRKHRLSADDLRARPAALRIRQAARLHAADLAPPERIRQPLRGLDPAGFPLHRRASSPFKRGREDSSPPGFTPAQTRGKGGANCAGPASDMRLHDPRGHIHLPAHCAPCETCGFTSQANARPPVKQSPEERERAEALRVTSSFSPRP